MRYLKEWPRLLLTLPNTIRLGLLTVCLTLGLGIHILTFPESHNGSLLLIPACLAAWMFKKRGLFTCAAIEIAAMVVYQTIRLNSIWWPLSFALFFWGGFLVLLLIGLIIISVRVLVDSSEAARTRAEHAEQQISIAYNQQIHMDELKDQFLLNVNHELCTPLTVLGNSLELLKEHYEHLDTIKRANVLARATESYEELVRLVNRVLDAVTVTGEFPPAQCEVISVHQVVQEIVAHLDPREAQAYAFHLQIPEQITVWADSQYLRQVLRNLLGNVIKYVPKQTEIRIEATQPAPSSPVHLIVQDAGPGIPPEELPHLFEKFVRLKRDLAGTKRGPGLGLYICKQLVEAMGGQIWVESSGRMGEGSRFCLTLPSSPPSSH